MTVTTTKDSYKAARASKNISLSIAKNDHRYVLVSKDHQTIKQIDTDELFLVSE